MDSDKLNIGYAGSLAWFSPEAKSEGKSWLRNTFGTYSVDNINQDTRSCYYLFKGLSYLKKHWPVEAAQVRLHLWGLIDPRNAQQAKQFDLEDIVHITGYIPKNESLQKMQDCDVLFLPLESSRNGQKPLFIPGKLFDYLKMKKPVLALAEASDCIDILSRSGLGVIVDPYNEVKVAEKLRGLVNDKQQLKQKYLPNEQYIDTFNFKNKTKELAKIFDDVLTETK